MVDTNDGLRYCKDRWIGKGTITSNHEWRLLKEVPLYDSSRIAGYKRTYYCIFCRQVVEDET